MATRKILTQTKTKTKTAAKKLGKKARVATLPNGYKVIGRAPNWDPEKDPVCEGERGETHEVTMDKGKKSERDVRTFVVQDETLGAVTVWESSMLRDLFDQTEEGQKVRVEFLGFGEAKKGQNPPKLFSCGVAE